MDLYFYTHLESDFNRKRVMALLEGKLILSDPARFNDPFDSKLRFRHKLTGTEAQAEFKRQGGFWGGFVPNADFAKGWVEKQRERISSEYRMFCFSERWDSLLMWAHYAKGHQGICLKLVVDLDKLPKGDLLEKIRYTTHYPGIDGEDVVKGDEKALRTLLLTKSTDWMYEEEWRYITHCNNCKRGDGFDYEHVDLTGLFKVEEICFGLNFEDHKMLLEIQKILGEQLNNAIEQGVSNTAGQNKDDVNKLANKCNRCQKVLIRLVERNSIKKLKKFFGNAWGDPKNSMKNCVSREQVLLKMRNKKTEVSRCKKTKGLFGLSLAASQHSKIEVLKRAMFGISHVHLDD